MYMNKEVLYKSVKQCTCLLSYYNEISIHINRIMMRITVIVL